MVQELRSREASSIICVLIRAVIIGLLPLGLIQHLALKRGTFSRGRAYSTLDAIKKMIIDTRGGTMRATPPF